jgi:hypothetical protein
MKRGTKNSGMTKKENNNNNSNDKEIRPNIFQIVDSIVDNVDRTKKLVVIMLVAIVISVPLSFHLTNLLTGPPYSYGPARILIPFLVILAFAVVGIRQWIVLSKWTKKYKEYKELQKEVDKKFDFETPGNNEP